MQVTSLKDQVKRLEEYVKNPVRRIGTGFKEVDNVIGGVAPGEVCTIVGRSFTGKSLVAQNIVWRNRHLPSVFFSLEMSQLQTLIRLYCIWSNRPSWEIQKLIDEGEMPDNMERFTEDFTNHVIVYKPAINVKQMSQVYDEYRDQFGVNPEFCVIDYLELVGGAKASAEGYQMTEAQITQITDWAKIEDTRVFLIHQANKSKPVWEPPDEDSARGGGFTESDFMIGLWRPHRNPELPQAEASYWKHRLAMNVIKNRVYFETLDETVLLFEPSSRLVGENERGFTPETWDDSPFDEVSTF